MPELVVGGALLRIGEDFAGLLRFLEFLFGLRVVGIAIGVEFHRQAAIGLFDLGLCGVLLNVQDFVEVTLAHAGTISPARFAPLLYGVRSSARIP